MAGTVAYIDGAGGDGSVVWVSEANPLPVNGVMVTIADVGITEVGGDTITAAGLPMLNVSSMGYETVAAGQTAQILGGSGAVGDWLDSVLIIPATTSPGVVTVLDNAISIPIFVGGALSVASLNPFSAKIGANSASGAWKITTGANVSVVAFGNFT